MTEFLYAFVDFIRSDTALWLLAISGAGVIATVVVALRTPREKQGGWRKVSDK